MEQFFYQFLQSFIFFPIQKTNEPSWNKRMVTKNLEKSRLRYVDGRFSYLWNISDETFLMCIAYVAKSSCRFFSMVDEKRSRRVSEHIARPAIPAGALRSRRWRTYLASWGKRFCSIVQNLPGEMYFWLLSRAGLLETFCQLMIGPTDIFLHEKCNGTKKRIKSLSDLKEIKYPFTFAAKL